MAADSAGGSGGGDMSGGAAGSNDGTAMNGGGPSQGGASASGAGGAAGGNGGSDMSAGSAGGGNGAGSSGEGDAGSVEPLPPLAEPMCLEDDGLLVFYEDLTRGASTTTGLSMVLGVEPITISSFELADLTLRYWFTDDGAFDFSTCPANGSGCVEIDYAAHSGGTLTDDVTVSFGEQYGSNYAEIGFTESATIVASSGLTLQVRLRGGGYETLTQTNDFSFVADADYRGNRHVTPYLAGIQVGGCEPLPP